MLMETKLHSIAPNGDVEIEPTEQVMQKITPTGALISPVGTTAQRPPIRGWYV